MYVCCWILYTRLRDGMLIMDNEVYDYLFMARKDTGWALLRAYTYKS